MSPIATNDIVAITRPEHGVEVIAELIKNSTLPFNDVIKYDESFAKSYPAVQVMSGGFTKELHATHTFLLTIRVDIYVMHAQLTEDRQTRNLRDLELATQLVAFLENQPDTDNPNNPNTLSLGGRCIASWVEKEDPGRMPPSGITQGRPVIGTLLSWLCTNEGRF